MGLSPIWDCHMGFYSSYGIFVVIREYKISIWLSIWFSYGIIYHMGLSYGNFHHMGFSYKKFLIWDFHMGICNKFVKFHFHMGIWNVFPIFKYLNFVIWGSYGIVLWEYSSYKIIIWNSTSMLQKFIF